jgi:PEP-CTERM motif
MTSSSSTLAALVAAAGLLCANQAQSIEVSILSASYSTDLSYALKDSSLALAVTSPSPVSYQFEAGTFGSTLNYAKTAGSADAFSVSAATVAFGGHANASATSVLSFSTLANVTGPLTLDFLAGGSSSFTAGLVNLFDMTTNQSLFSYEWTRFGMGGVNNVPWPFAPLPAGEAIVNLQPQLFASHDYRLTMHVNTDASSDGQSASISLGGFKVVSPVPEPETYALMLMGLGVLGFVARRRKGQSSAD